MNEGGASHAGLSQGNWLEGHWDIGSLFGVPHPLLVIEREPIFFSLVTFGIILFGTLIARRALRKGTEGSGPSYGSFAVEQYARFGMNLVQQSLGRVHAPYACFVLALGTYILIANWMVLLPGGEEPTKNLNITFALSITSFLYIQRAMIKTHGLRAYLGHFFKMPLSYGGISWYSIGGILKGMVYTIINVAVAILLFPLELLSRCATILSMSFRLFGNIVGGSIITGLWQQLLASSTIVQVVGLLTGFNIIILGFFGMFEGAIQAFVFTMLTVTSLGLALGDSEHAEESL